MPLPFLNIGDTKTAFRSRYSHLPEMTLQRQLKDEKCGVRAEGFGNGLQPDGKKITMEPR